MQWLANAMTAAIITVIQNNENYGNQYASPTEAMQYRQAP